MAENVKKSISSDSASEGNQFRKEESPLYQPEAGGGAGGAAATTNPGNPKGNEASGNEKKARLIRLIIAIVGLVLAVVALIPSILCSLLWWYWIWVLTVPGLILGICGLVLVFLNKKEAPLVCAGVAIIINLSAIIWGSVEVGLANSYQGQFSVKKSEIGGSGDPLADPVLEAIQVNRTLLPKDKLEKAFYFHRLGRYCEGRAYDWSFRKAQITEKMDCKRETDDWFLEKILHKSDSRYERCEVKSAYEGVDSYSESPIYKTHEDRKDRIEYNDDKQEEEQQKELKKFCKDFDPKEFIEQREKCDEKIKEKLKPECKPKKGGLLFTKFKMEWKVSQVLLEKFGTRGTDEFTNTEKKELEKHKFDYQLEEPEKGKLGSCAKIARSYSQSGVKTAIYRVYQYSKYKSKLKQAKDNTDGKFGNVFKKINFLDTATEEVDGFEVEGHISCDKKEKFSKSLKQKAVDTAQNKVNFLKGQKKEAEALKEAMVEMKKTASAGINAKIEELITGYDKIIADNPGKISKAEQEVKAAEKKEESAFAPSGLSVQ